MKHIKSLAAFLSVATLLLAGCSQPLAAPPTSAKSTMGGSLKISIPTVAPWLAEALAKSSSGTRAFLHAAKAEVTLLEQVGATGDASKDWSPIAGPLALNVVVAGNGTSVSGELTNLPPGHGYRLKVDIWANSTDVGPVVEGIADDVWVDVNNTNQVGVGCLPLSATPLDLVASSPLVIATTVIGAKSEVWYAIQVKKNTYYHFDFTSTNGAVGFVFDRQGRLWQTLGNSDQRTIKTWDSSIIYFGVSGGDSTEGSFGVTATLVPGSNLTGTIAFPPGSKDKKYRFTTWSDNGYNWTNEGTVPEELTATVNLSGLPPFGLYTFVGKLEGSLGSWSGDSSGPAGMGDLAMKAKSFGCDGFTPVVLSDVLATDWGAFAGVSWSGSQYSIEPGAQLVVGVDSRSLGDAILALWNQVHPEASGMVRYMNVGSDTALDHNSKRDGLQSDVTLAIQNSLLVHQDEVLPLDSHMATAMNELDPTLLAWVNANVGGNTLGLPIAYDGMAFAWNKSMLTALGIDVTDADTDGLPEAFDTWEEIFAIAKTWSRPTYSGKTVNVVYPLSLDEPWSGYAGITAGGWRIFSTAEASKPGFDSPDFLKGLEFLKAASDAPLSREADGSKTPGGMMGWRWDGFLNDRSSPFGMVGTWMDITGASNKTGEKIVISRMPTWKGVRPAPFLKAKVLAVDKGSYFPSAAMELLRVLYTKDGIQALVDSTAYVPTLKDGSALAPTLAATSPQTQFAKAFAFSALEPLNLALPSGKPVMDLYYNIGINQVYKDVWDGKQTPAEAQSSVVANAQSWLSKN